ncbi:hypothetical protein CYY_008903 [Polysphondylium violaceum]|uniref:SHSP domain-containing protein n=1 Tax=Polysphondylium violaceum TaxID=133409 RepID=A0A8J4UWK1_9MYCE|nr:hypothetical protein CYY_008903 [Polysphondylium violaceum]
MATFYNLYDLINYLEKTKENDSTSKNVNHQSNTPQPTSQSSNNNVQSSTKCNNFKYQEREPSFEPNVDLYETKDTVYIELEVPGVEKSDINIDWNSNASKLVVSGARKKNELLSNNDSKLLVNELEYGNFKREIKLNSNLINLPSINANLNNGVLLIKISKKPQDSLNIKVNIQ